MSDLARILASGKTCFHSYNVPFKITVTRHRNDQKNVWMWQLSEKEGLPLFVEITAFLWLSYKNSDSWQTMSVMSVWQQCLLGCAQIWSLSLDASSIWLSLCCTLLQAVFLHVLSNFLHADIVYHSVCSIVYVMLWHFLRPSADKMENTFENIGDWATVLKVEMTWEILSLQHWVFFHTPFKSSDLTGCVCCSIRQPEYYNSIGLSEV